MDLNWLKNKVISVKIFALSFVVIMQTSCSHFFESGGHRAFAKVDIHFIGDSKTLNANDRVYIVERIGTANFITNTITMNKDQIISLRGEYCFPVVVAVKSGNITLHSETLKPEYSVILTHKPAPSPEDIFGPPLQKYRQYSKIHRDCG